MSYDRTLQHISDRARFAIVYSVLTFIIFLRRPDALLNAQPYAEDGPVFLGLALKYSYNALPLTYVGYLHTVPRIVTLLSLSVAGLPNAPLVMNLSALVLNSFCVSYFSLPRFRIIIRRDAYRLLACILMACLPTTEIYLNITNIHWFLALFFTLWALDQWFNFGVLRERCVFGAYLEGALAALATLSAPECLVLLPALAVLVVRRLQRHEILKPRAKILLAVIGCEITQTYVFLTNWQSAVTAINAQTRFNGSITDAFRSEVLSKVLIVPILHNSVPRIYGWVVYVIIVVSVAGIILHAVLSGRNAIDVSLSSILVVILLGTVIGRNIVLLGILFFGEVSGEVSRHFFIPLCILLVLVLRLATREKTSLKSKAILLVFLLLLTSYSAAFFRIQPYVDFGWKSYTAEFDPAGNWSLWIPINPPGWVMRISSNPAKLMLGLNQMAKLKGGLGLITMINGENVLANRTIMDKCAGNPYLLLQGWATSETGTVRAVYLVLDNSYAFPTTYEASSVTQSTSRLAEWMATISTSNLTTGSHELSIWILLTINRIEIVDDVSSLQVSSSCTLTQQTV